MQQFSTSNSTSERSGLVHFWSSWLILYACTRANCIQESSEPVGLEVYCHMFGVYLINTVQLHCFPSLLYITFLLHTQAGVPQLVFIQIIAPRFRWLEILSQAAQQCFAEGKLSSQEAKGSRMRTSGAAVCRQSSALQAEVKTEHFFQGLVLQL